MPMSGHGADGRLANCHDAAVKFSDDMQILKPTQFTNVLKQEIDVRRNDKAHLISICTSHRLKDLNLKMSSLLRF
jgi:hypothetical protein